MGWNLMWPKFSLIKKKPMSMEDFGIVVKNLLIDAKSDQLHVVTFNSS